jgi:hypothetical protein
LATVIGLSQASGEVNLELLIDLAKQGLPGDDPVVRLHLYEILLRVRPLDRSKWESTLSSRSSLYWSWVGKYFANRENWLDLDFLAEGVTRKAFGLTDNDTMSQIHGDLARTPSIPFARLHLGATDAEIRPHMRRIERLLYVFSCLNAAYSYTQGFNDLAIPMYHIAIGAHRAMGNSDDAGEAAAFFLLQNLITGTGMGDLFTMAQDMDSVASKFDLIKDMTKSVDSKLYDHIFVRLQIAPLQFAFSWVSVLFSELYSMESLLVLWDRFLLKESDIVAFAMAIAAAHLLEARAGLLAGKNFAEIMSCLSGIRDLDPSVVIALAEDMWSRYIASEG